MFIEKSLSQTYSQEEKMKKSKIHSKRKYFSGVHISTRITVINFFK